MRDLARIDWHASGSRLVADPDHRRWRDAGDRRAPQTERGPSDTSDDQKPSRRAGGAAPSAFLHHPRHHRHRRLCLAEGRQLAGGAARSLDPRSGYPQLSRSRERLHRKPARPHRGACRRSWSRKCAGGSRRTIPACRRRTGLTPICANSARAASTRCSAACRATAARPRSCSTATSSRPSTNISSSAAAGIRRTTGCRPGAPTSRARNISRSGCATGPTAPIATIWSRKPTARVVWSADCQELLLRQARRQPSPDAGLAASARHAAGGRCAGL